MTPFLMLLLSTRSKCLLSHSFNPMYTSTLSFSFGHHGHIICVCKQDNGRTKILNTCLTSFVHKKKNFKFDSFASVFSAKLLSPQNNFLLLEVSSIFLIYQYQIEEISNRETIVHIAVGGCQVCRNSSQ